MGIEKVWKEFAGGSRIPYLGVAAHADWADANPQLVAKLYKTYRDATDWIQKNPEEAAPLVAPGATAEDVKAMATLIRANNRLGISLATAAEVRKEIEAVYKAGVDVGYFPSLPSLQTAYDKPM
jgi:ABC-type nitrate/sulfonate/bicarbonate transport system substrate-binding protein